MYHHAALTTSLLTKNKDQFIRISIFAFKVNNTTNKTNYNNKNNHNTLT